jgi:ketosteroid isomerase-like protein
MSQENVELHRRAVDAFNRRDLDAFLLLADDEVAINPLTLELEGGSYHGHDGIRSFWEAYLRVFPDFTAEVDELRDLGEVTVARVRLHGHGTGSDVPFEQPISQVARWRDRRCLCWRSFRSEADALDAAAPPG